MKALLQAFYLALEQGNLPNAQNWLLQLQKTATHSSETYTAQGRLYELQHQYPQALNSYGKAYQLTPQDPEILNNLAGLHLHLHQPLQALPYLQTLTTLFPTPTSFYNMAQVHAQLKQWGTALSSLEHALTLGPLPVDTAYWHAHLASQVGQVRKALTLVSHLCQKTPSAELWLWQVSLMLRLGKREQAVQSLQKGVSLFKDPQLLQTLGNLLAEDERLEEAIFWQEQAWQLDASASRLEALLRLYPPAIAPSNETIHQWQSRLHELLQQAQTLTFDPMSTPKHSAKFYLAYQTQNPRALMQAWALWEKKLLPSYTHPPRHNKPVKRIAWVSAFFREHSVARCFANTFRHMAHHPHLEVGVFSLMRRDRHPLWQDSTALQFQQQAQFWAPLYEEDGFATSCRNILTWEPDIIIYPDIGMHPWSDALAHQRLAPQQWVLPGHPVTTGIPSLDAFITFGEAELPEAAQHYSEPLIRLPGTFDYSFPQIPWPLHSRSRLGLPSDKHIYFCPMTPFKIHPNFDDLIHKLLREDPIGEVWLLQYRHPEFTLRLQQRFQSRMPTHIHHRIRFIPWLDKRAFFSLLLHADVCLETTHFGGGNTTYQAAAVGKPLVICAGQSLASRLSWCIYHHGEFYPTLATNEEHYLEIALNLAHDPLFSKQTQKELYHKRASLFNHSRWSQALIEQCLNEQ